MKRIAIIGGGASGMMAACHAARDGAEVTIFEKQDKVGKKILITGNGRCNITNRDMGSHKYHAKNPRFPDTVLSKFGLEDTEKFFESLGLPLKEGKNGKLFPASLQASSVVKVFVYELNRKKVSLELHRKVDAIRPAGDSFEIVTAGREKRSFDSVILSAGSCAYPQVGGTMSGFDLAQTLGHTVINPFPAILPINIPLKALHRLQGIKWDCGIQAVFRDKVLSAAEGEVLFTGYGLSGTAALDISRAVNEMILKGKTPDIILDFFPGISSRELMDRFSMLWSDMSKKLSFSLMGCINDRIPQVVLEICGVNPDIRVSSLDAPGRSRVVDAFKSFRLSPGKPRSFQEAVVAAGGIDIDEVDPSTMESKIVRNLYITGELLDIDGVSGGYNLQFAWSTGAIAGMSQ